MSKRTMLHSKGLEQGPGIVVHGKSCCRKDSKWRNVRAYDVHKLLHGPMPLSSDPSEAVRVQMFDG